MKKIIPLLVIGFLVLSGFGAIAIQTENEKLEFKTIKSIIPIKGGRDFTHTVLGEYGTATWCNFCKYAHGALKNIYAGGWFPFYYISMVGDKNNNAYSRIKDDYNLYGYPTLWWDGGYRVDLGASSIPSAQAAYNASILACGNRAVNDIDISLGVEWQGPGNPSPADGKNNVTLDKCLTWTNSEMKISVSIKNNEGSTYKGTLRVYVTEVVTSMGWYDMANNPYTFTFLDFAFEEGISINTGQTWQDNTYWDGMDHNDGFGNDFRNITQENIMLIAAVFDDEKHQGYSRPPDQYPFDAYYVDETKGFLAGTNTDPKTYDVYFGVTNPPPKVVSNQSSLKYCPSGLNFSTKYYWQIVVWDNQGNSISGPIWSFTTRGNVPPNKPSNPNPEDNQTGVPIDTCISWTSEDPDGDEVTYDVYFGKYDPGNDPPLVSSNQSSTTYCPEDLLDFNTKYHWFIVAWDEFDYSSTGEKWVFTTEENQPPNKPSDPDPPDGATEVSINEILRWTGGDPNQGDKVWYDVYFGNSYPPPLVVENLTQEVYDPGTMDVDTVYYWKIVSEDSQGLTTAGPIWSFTTEIEHNEPPTAPDIDGPQKGSARVELCWTFHSNDPNGDQIKYIIDWGDGNSEETSFNPPCEPVEVCHRYEKQGTYQIKATAQDDEDLMSEESTFDVLIPRYRSVHHSLLIQFFERLINAFPILKNLLGLY